MCELQQIWWERVPNALSFINDIVGNLVNEKSIILQYSFTIPWREFFISSVKNNVKQQNFSKSFETVSGSENPGLYLLNTFCKTEKKAQYRPSKRFADFLAESDDIVLHERYIWVYINSAEDLESWTSFVSDYLKSRDKRKPAAVFVLEWQGNEPIAKRKGITLNFLDAYIGEYDRVVFSMLASSSLRIDTFKKNYFAELVSNVVGNDIEMYTVCFKNYNDFMRDPYETIRKYVSENTQGNHADFHFSKSINDVNHDIWLSQIKTIYPVIEEYRENFVYRHEAAIRSQLPIPSFYGDEYSDPNDVELGVLIYLAGCGKLNLKNKEYDILKAFKDARNTLSHLGILSMDDIEFLSNSIGNYSAV